jgi:hypothetical protein
MALDRTWYNSLVNDDGSGKTGTIWRKEDVGALMNTVDQEIARLDDNININVVQYLDGVSGVVNDLELLPYTRLLIIRNTAPLTLTGMKAGNPGQSVIIMSRGPAPIYLPYIDGRSLPGNQLVNTVASGVTPLAPFWGRAEYVYEASPGSMYWEALNHIQGQSLQNPYSPALFTANNGATWTVTQAGAADLSYNVIGKTLALNIWINLTAALESVLSGPTAPTILSIKLPNGYTLARGQRSPSVSYFDTSGQGIAIAAAAPNSPDLVLARDLTGTTPWPLGGVAILLAIFLEIQ